MLLSSGSSSAHPAGPVDPSDPNDSGDPVDLDGAPAGPGPAAHGRGPRTARPSRPGPWWTGGAAWPDRTPPWVRSPLGTALAAVAAACAAGALASAHTAAVQAQRVRAEQSGAVAVVAGGGALMAVRVPDATDYNTRATMDLQVVNAGPRPVTLLGAHLQGDGALVVADLGGGRALAPAASTYLVLAGPVRCALDRSAATSGPTVRLRTEDGAVHEHALSPPSTPSWSGALERACSLGVVHP